MKLNIPSVWVNKGRMGGRPCLRGTRFPIGQLIYDIIMNDKFRVADYCKDFDLDKTQVFQFIKELEQFFELRDFEEE